MEDDRVEPDDGTVAGGMEAEAQPVGPQKKKSVLDALGGFLDR